MELVPFYKKFFSENFCVVKCDSLVRADMQIQNAEEKAHNYTSSFKRSREKKTQKAEKSEGNGYCVNLPLLIMRKRKKKRLT